MENNVLSQKGKSALIYAIKLNWPVFPLHTPLSPGCSCNNPNCNSVGKHPRISKGLHGATTNTDIIKKWWKRWPNSNIGLITGRKSGVVALDVDPRNNGDDSLDLLVEQHGRLPHTIEAITGGDGRHILFKHQGFIKNRTNMLSGLDIRGDGGYIVAPPSLHNSGKIYEWGASNRPFETMLAELPPWLSQLIMEPKKRVERKPIQYWKDIIGGVNEGNRNTSAASFAGYLLRHGINASIAYELMVLWNERNNPPESEEVIERVFTSILEAELKRLKGGENEYGAKL